MNQTSALSPQTVRRRLKKEYPTLTLRITRKAFGRPRKFVLIHDNGVSDFPLMEDESLDNLMDRLGKYAKTEEGKKTLDPWNY